MFVASNISRKKSPQTLEILEALIIFFFNLAYKVLYTIIWVLNIKTQYYTHR